MKFLQIFGLLALCSTGCIRAEASVAAFAPAEPPTAETYKQCKDLAEVAYAVTVSREAGKPRSDLLKYIDENEGPMANSIFKRIINKVYDNPSIGKDAAYDGEMTHCLTEERKKKQK